MRHEFRFQEAFGLSPAGVRCRVCGMKAEDATSATCDMTCLCENRDCRACDTARVPGTRCERKATVRCAYIGGICARCAEYMPEEYTNPDDFGDENRPKVTLESYGTVEGGEVKVAWRKPQPHVHSDNDDDYCFCDAGVETWERGWDW